MALVLSTPRGRVTSTASARNMLELPFWLDVAYTSTPAGRGNGGHIALKGWWWWGGGGGGGGGCP